MGVKDFRAMFERFGAIEDARILTDAATKASRGVGFVHYTTKESAANALKTLAGTIPQGVRRAAVFECPTILSMYMAHTPHTSPPVGHPLSINTCVSFCFRK